MKKRQKAERGRAGKHKGAQPRSAATTPKAKALQESEAKFRSLVENTAAPIGIIDLTGDFTYVNKALAHLTGYTVQELVGRPFMDFLHPEDREVVLGTFMKGVSTSEEAPEIEFRIKRRDGQILTLTSKPTRLEIDGKTAGFQAIITDISGRKQAGEALQLSEMKHRTLFENVPHGIYRSTPEGKLLAANRALARLLGYDSEVELLAADIGRAIYVNPEDRKTCMTKLEKEGELRNFELLLRRKDGQVLTVLDNAHVVRDERGAILYYEGTLTDLTERKRAEKALKESGERYRLLFESSPIGIGLSSPDGKVFSSNQEMQSITGYTADELKRINLADTYVNPEDRRKLLEAIDQDGRVSDYHVLLRRKDGTPYDALLSISQIHIGDSDFFQTTCIDITERKRIEQVLRDSEERYRELADSVTDVFFAMDKGLRYTYWNEASEDLTGISAKDAIGKSLYELFPDVKGTRAEEVYLEVLRAGQPRSFVNEYKLHGKQFFFEISAYPTRWGISVFTRDITERKRMEEKMRISEERYRNLVENSKDSIVILDMKGNVLFGNKATEELTGYSVADGVGMNVRAITPLRYWPKSLEMLLKARTGKPVPYFESVIKRKDGHLVAVETGGQAILQNGKVVGLQIITRDITERKRAEQELRENEEKYRKLFEEAMDGIAVADPDTGILLDCNQALAALVGRNRAQLIGQHQAILHPPSGDNSELSPTFKLHLTTHEGQMLETQVITGTGQIKEVEIKASLLHLQGRRILQGIFRDITERKRAEEALRRWAEELAALQATVLDITSRHDLEVLLETIVERAARLLRVSSGGMYLCDPQKREVRCVVSYRTPYDIKGTVLKYGEGAAGTVAETGNPLLVDDYRTWEGRAVAYEETKPFVAVLGVPVIWQGQVTGVIDVLDDSPQHFTQADQELLTLFANHAAIAVENARLLEQEKRHAEELTRYSTNLEQLVFERTGKLAESERRFRELADLLPQIVFEIDVKGDFKFVNRIAFAITGYTEEDFREGLNALQMVVPEDRNRVMENIRRILAGEALPANEYVALRKDGSTFPVLIHSSPIIHDGRPVGLRGIIIDITERKHAEEELRSARERLEYVISSNPAVIYAGKPRKDYSDYDATYLSESVVKVLGFEPQDFIGHPEFWEGRLPADDLRQYSAEVPILWKEGQHTFEYRFLHKDGTYRWIREEVKLIRDAAGNPVEVMGYWLDVTEQKQMQEALVKSQRLATIGETAAMIGHDLRNPLEAIAGATYLLRRQAAAGTIDDDGRESLQIIEKSIEYSDKIINDLLEYSAEIRPQTSTTDPKSVTDTALSLAWIPENVRIVNEAQTEPRMVVDADKIRRAFLNIIRNAVEAMPQGGTLTISSRRTDGMVEFKFADTGAGMSRETLGNLWTPLFTTKARGMGFGLPITRRIVEAHGGTVGADSAPGGGSTFTVKLPVETEARAVSGS